MVCGRMVEGGWWMDGLWLVVDGRSLVEVGKGRCIVWQLVVLKDRYSV